MRKTKKRIKKRIKKNSGFTMLELVITVALVSIFFGVVAAIIPTTLNAYISMKNLASAMQLTNLIENGLAAELSTATSICFDEDNGIITYVKNKEQRTFPSNEDTSLMVDGFTTLDELDHKVFIDYEGTSEEISTIEVGGKMTNGGRIYIFDSVCDDGVYADYTAKITIKYVVESNSYEMLVCVYDENDAIISSSQKPIIMYNDF